MAELELIFYIRYFPFLFADYCFVLYCINLLLMIIVDQKKIGVQGSRDSGLKFCHSHYRIHWIIRKRGGKLE